MQRLVLDPLAQRVLEGAFEPGARLEADWDTAASEVVFRRLEAARSAPAAAGAAPEPGHAARSAGSKGRKG
jgi:hypothetical protein